MASIFEFSRKKTNKIVTSLSCDLKKGLKMEASVIDTPINDNNFLLKLFWEGMYLKFEIVHKSEKYSLRNTSRKQNIEFVG